VGGLCGVDWVDWTVLSGPCGVDREDRAEWIFSLLHPVRWSVVDVDWLDWTRWRECRSAPHHPLQRVNCTQSAPSRPLHLVHWAHRPWWMWTGRCGLCGVAWMEWTVWNRPSNEIQFSLAQPYITLYNLIKLSKAI